ncbi:CBS domain-containing protein [Serpentinicella sp. ANB-PHB4]|uniref:CBS domain-containing protein n=1 Tax=Serpentinicella sp. ANB-PHB4 TaxID=3074076 RepID=UPI00285717A9|nr:CBS domain-containing protein [Serpentinicella sp. ANB-PHB4]MDR5658166.1 CBS domain-containing protein [Serpentinicella sp. ANB-PHB4]
MRVITSHQNLDFDGLASMVACSKIYPNSVMVFSGSLDKEVKKFYNLYKNILIIKQINQIDISSITELIIVDENKYNRIGKFKSILKKDIPITIYDHHSCNNDTIQNANKTIKILGSCTSILIEEIIKNNIILSNFEATLCLLGVYADTNCLTFEQTKPNDATAVAYLLDKGANLEVVKKYLQFNLNEKHSNLLIRLLSEREEIFINGHKLIICTFKTDEFIGELGYITNKMIDLVKTDAIFNIVKMENRCYIVSRISTNIKMDLREVLVDFGGKGHSSAASAVIKDGDPINIKNQLLSIIHIKLEPSITAEDIMNFPVKSLYENMTIEEAHNIMLRHGHSGMPVVNEYGRITGMVSRTDIDKAIIHNLKHAPVKGFMSVDVKTVNYDESVDKVSELLTKYNIGRLPVLKHDEVIGIVTRSNIIKTFHGGDYPRWYETLFKNKELEYTNLAEKIKNLPQDQYNIILKLSKVADQLACNVYVVGGFVRDLVMNRENYDMDIVVEGEGIAFAKEVSGYFGGEIDIHDKFNTASVILPSGQQIDIVTARREYYEHPAALPKIENSSIRNDLFRRDFTINCIALKINTIEFGRLIDPFGGLGDIGNQQLRVLYNLSFIEDPTRIFRAIRFSARLGFDIEKNTKNLLIKAIHDNMLKKLSNDRVRAEINHILKEDKYLKNSLELLNCYNILKSLHPQFNITTKVLIKIEEIDKSVEELCITKDINKYIIIVIQLLSDVPLKDIEDIISIITTSAKTTIEVINTLKKKDDIYDLLSDIDKNSFYVYEELKKYSLESIVYYYNDTDNPNIKKSLIFYLQNLRKIILEIKGSDIKELGVIPGPIYKSIFREILKEKVLGNLKNKEDEIKYAREYISRLNRKDL